MTSSAKSDDQLSSVFAVTTADSVCQPLVQFSSEAATHKRAGEQRVLIVSHVALVRIYLSQAMTADW